jgi:hypothetical protein
MTREPKVRRGGRAGNGTGSRHQNKNEPPGDRNDFRGLAALSGPKRPTDLAANAQMITDDVAPREVFEAKEHQPAPRREETNWNPARRQPRTPREIGGVPILPDEHCTGAGDEPRAGEKKGKSRASPSQTFGFRVGSWPGDRTTNTRGWDAVSHPDYTPDPHASGFPCVLVLDFTFTDL